MIFLLKSHPLIFPGPRSAAQARAGNYKKRRLPWRGLKIRIENEAGTIRRGRDRNGKEWAVWMLYPYGYFERSEGTDGDAVDCFVGPSAEAPNVFIVRAMKAGDWKTYDEDKAFVCFESADDARAAFLANYTDPRFLGEIVAMPAEEFVAKVKKTYEEPGMIKSKLFLVSSEFAKAHVPDYTKKDGTRVKAHDDRRPTGKKKVSHRPVMHKKDEYGVEKIEHGDDGKHRSLGHVDGAFKTHGEADAHAKKLDSQKPKRQRSSGKDAGDDYAERVRKHEEKGMTTSDAQAVVDAEDEKNPPSGPYRARR